VDAVCLLLLARVDALRELEGMPRLDLGQPDAAAEELPATA
jgi:hypothetical protein